MAQASADYLAAGANRHPSAADWDTAGLLAYGADRNVALWQPQNETSRGVHDLLDGHTDTVNAVKFVPGTPGLLLSGSVDKTVKIWSNDQSTNRYSCIQTLSDHSNSINCIGVSSRSSKIFVTGAADFTVKVWSLDDEKVASLRQTINIAPKFFPLSLALCNLADSLESYVLAVAGTKDIIQLYVRDAKNSPEFKLQATLAGHEGWIRSLEFTQESFNPKSDLILASASQDKYIRLWRIHQGTQLPAAAASADPSLGAFMPGKSLSNKAHRFRADDMDFSATFEALLLGHEDWIYSTKWFAVGKSLQLLSASADNSLAIWEPDETTGVWVTVARMGEISSEKGSTTATGSTGGFWTGLWSPSGKTVVCLGRTGSWRLWNYDLGKDKWVQSVGVSGHTQSVTGIAWSKEGDYLLSTSSDQTTRLHARWKRDDIVSWHEMARPQIHGYDLNCIDSLGASQFISGAEEKLLRVFSEPKAVANLLHTLCGFSSSHVEDMPDAANMPVLGLSNKAIEKVADDHETGSPQDKNVDPASIVRKSTLKLSHPPLEDQLSRHTLWPEIEKLYGHGYEISALAASHDGSLVATACKATSLDHAVIRIFETESWHEVKPPLTAHTLTVARLRFSSDDAILLSVGRDRQWAVFQREAEGEKEGNGYKLLEANLKGHSRMILDAAWAPMGGSVFATAGRDKQVKFWAREEASTGGYVCKATIAEEHPVTAVDFMDRCVADGRAYLAVGTEVGRVRIYCLDAEKAFDVTELGVEYPSAYPYPSKAITQLAWKPHSGGNAGRIEMQLAVASEDSSLRIYSLGLPEAAGSE
ncbi:WD domain-containing protein [Drepanopeziza brunnea f. sp. 'multigermtubi' MB_m1]|uniref:Elongator complex protein 2 n=1 Tax=Marssonina brunnea f. sp. multigermtubi (strain MB_m1) TaxID=1072389 RepID=K1W8N1_MARBU|nr:WD domain-containing protein [Drepanopeziza brunnea f. sp. 'multigermtubi' MB_m1]EKD13555.1 WD domain-containing protein [Drepanopeziza brunnea f. sp. 'multigermtubi' MB_m1]